MATVHLGRLVGPDGFGRTVAIKRLHPHLAKEPEFVTMLTDEARVAGRIGHPNIVSTLDIVAADGEKLSVALGGTAGFSAPVATAVSTTDLFLGDVAIGDTRWKR